jgi:prepilin-type N-terminal cleavage/methylation domain-containing protein
MEDNMKASTNKRSNQAGFTLVEIAIVLVIIGLLLGGILKGQEMITQAKIKNIINDFNGITAAINSYQDRYRALPGDDLNAAGRWLNPQAISGDGNGQLCTGPCANPPATPNIYNNTVATTVAAPEVNLFWWHLRLAGFVGGSTAAGAGSSASPPSNAANGIMGVQTGGPAGFFTSNMICSSNLPDKIAIAVDTQMDDGTANLGQVRANVQAVPNPELHAIAIPADAYVESGTNQYVLCKNM